MSNKKLNINLTEARKNKNDEFYTQLVDIENELKHYKNHFKDKVVYCNCDDPHWSNFSEYFRLNFSILELKGFISTHYEPDESKSSYMLELVKDPDDGQRTIYGYSFKKTPLKGNGDFKSQECIKLLQKADIVVTNPPFSLLREYISQLIKFKKDFLIICNQNTITYKDIFTLIKQNKIWSGINCGDMSFKVPEHYEAKELRYWVDADGQKWRSMGNIQWLTNLSHLKRNEWITLVKKYRGNEKEYPHYENYNAINVNKVKDIPEDYNGVMGVPITFLDKYNPEQFTILGMTDTQESFSDNGIWIQGSKKGRGIVNGKIMYARVLIKNKNPVNV